MSQLDAATAAGVRRLLAAGSLATLAACTTAPPPAPTVDPVVACAALAAPIAAASIALPTRGATIDTASYVAASAEAAAFPLPFVPPPPEAVIVPAMPGHCSVVGRIAPVGRRRRRRCSLPGQSARHAGAGAICSSAAAASTACSSSGLALPPSARIDKPAPLMRGFVTAGTDSGPRQRCPAWHRRPLP